MNENELLRVGDRVVVGVSGGIDSVVLLDILSRLSVRMKLTLIVAHVNYRLRGKESDGDERFVQGLAERAGYEFVLSRVRPGQVRNTKKMSLQMAARTIRYAFFEEEMRMHDAQRIAVGHTADDNAETMLINLFRGSGVDGLAGIPPRRDAIVRPLLSLTRKEIERYAKERKLKFREDRTNAKNDYARNAVRHAIIPAAAKRLNPSVVETMFHEAETFRMNGAFVRESVDRAANSAVTMTANGCTVDTAAAEREHPFIRQMLFHRVLTMLGCEPSLTTIAALATLSGSQKGKRIVIDKRWTAERTDGAVTIGPAGKPGSFTATLEREGTVAAGGFVFSITRASAPHNTVRRDPSIEYIDASQLRWPVTVRSWRPGDIFQPLGLRGSKKLSDFFVDRKLSARDKAAIPIVVSGDRIVWVGGCRLDERFKITPSTTDVYQLTLTNQHGETNGHHQQ